jgi:hypothetical protein
MIKHRETITRSIFLLAVLFCVGMHAYSDSVTRSPVYAGAPHANYVGLIIIADIDSFDDDQINQTNNISSITEHHFQLQIPRDCFLSTNFFMSIWQPPKTI